MDKVNVLDGFQDENIKLSFKKKNTSNNTGKKENGNWVWQGTSDM